MLASFYIGRVCCVTRTLSRETIVQALLGDPEKIYEMALDKWGGDAQLGIIFEELGELMSQISRFFIRERGSIEELASEVADAEICCEQLRLMMTRVYPEAEELIEAQREFKLRRLIERLHDRPDPPKPTP